MCKYRNLIALLVITVFFSTTASIAQAQQENALMKQINALPWQRGPSEGKLGTKGIIKVPTGFMFLDSSGTRQFLELNENPPRDNEYVLAPIDLSWFAIFGFSQVGYVKDDEKLDADNLLKTLKERDGPANKERERLGMQPLYTIGWVVPPHYDLETKRLEWGMNLKGPDDYYVVNYKVRILGRSGVMESILVTDVASLERDVGAFKKALRGFNFVSGERYSEYRSGDKVAEYGLAALIVGGAAAAVAKSGTGKILGKVIFGAIAVAFVVAIGFLKRVFGRRAWKTK